MTYRNDIDGLRAIAILGVVLYHAGLKQMSGGYAGVDVFFVISGYLIGGNIFDELSSGTFSFKRFYLRRIRRILPALIVMVLATMCLGWFTMMPNDYRYMGGAAVTALLSLSNVWFYNRIDYFNPEATQDPLLHTWSLGIEEQFYAIIPLLLFLFWRWRPKAVLPVLLGIAILSLAITLLTSSEYRMEAFYLLHTRAWELLAGVLVAWFARKALLPAQWHTPLYAIGLLLILAGLWIVPPSAPWPSLWTLPTVIGTALVLASPTATASLQALLSNRLMRFFGLISYSLYLWHQPVFGLLKKAQAFPQSAAGVLAVLAALIAISTLSWRFVEQPFRGHKPVPKTRVFAAWGAFAAIWAIAIGGAVTKGYPSRVPDAVHDVLAIKNSYSPTYRKCLISRGQVPGYDTETACVFGPDATPTTLIIGDSHGARLAEPLANALAQKGVTSRQLTLSSCLPVAGLINVGQSRASQCPAFNQLVLDHLDRAPAITDVVVFATWKNYVFSTSGPNMLDYVAPDGFYSEPLSGPDLETDLERKRAFTNALSVQLSELADNGRDVILVLPTPRPDVDIPSYFATRLWWGSQLPERAGYPRRIYDELGAEMRTVFSTAIAGSELTEDVIKVVDPAEEFCDVSQCDLIRNGQLLFSDGNHPSLAGLQLIVPTIAEAVVDH